MSLKKTEKENDDDEYTPLLYTRQPKYVGFPYTAVCSNCFFEMVYSYAQPKEYCDCDCPLYYHNADYSPLPKNIPLYILENGEFKVYKPTKNSMNTE